MSRIGNKPVKLPGSVKAEYKDNIIFIEGAKGKLQYGIHPQVELSIEDGLIVIKAGSAKKESRAFQGMTRALIANMVTGVSEGFKKVLEVNGVGYRAELKGKDLVLNLGYSNPVTYPVPESVDIAVEGNKISVSGIDKQKVGQVAAEIRKIRPPEPYKGKGVKYVDENIIRKAGKAAKA
ncbi:MAG: 50S ribosomal protein L6 [Deltaproteobacteria bacterium]|nr:MAG: 50S ribosomal protein L6 [Deltaproteobacteria bacterium]PIE75274.1 MAG: 50S ribosomal protein L6 [Deltaproteobacteria bacterium]